MKNETKMVHNIPILSTATERETAKQIKEQALVSNTIKMVHNIPPEENDDDNE